MVFLEPGGESDRVFSPIKRNTAKYKYVHIIVSGAHARKREFYTRGPPFESSQNYSSFGQDCIKCSPSANRTLQRASAIRGSQQLSYHRLAGLSTPASGNGSTSPKLAPPRCYILYYTILYYTILYYTILYYTIVYYSIL